MCVILDCVQTFVQQNNQVLLCDTKKYKPAFAMFSSSSRTSRARGLSSCRKGSWCPSLVHCPPVSLLAPGLDHSCYGEQHTARVLLGWGSDLFALEKNVSYIEQSVSCFASPSRYLCWISLNFKFADFVFIMSVKYREKRLSFYDHNEHILNHIWRVFLAKRSFAYIYVMKVEFWLSLHALFNTGWRFESQQRQHKGFSIESFWTGCHLQQLNKGCSESQNPNINIFTLLVC